MNISVCIITKNECSKLEKCLQCIKDIADEIVVVDTGSTDDTVKMVRGYASSVYEFDWIDDFAAAKNYAISKAINDYVLVVDSDEYLREGYVDELKKLVSENPKSVGRIKRLDCFRDGKEYTESVTWTNRLFDRRLFHYEHRIHEQVVVGSVFEYLDKRTYMYSEERASYDTYELNLVFDHDGYDGNREYRDEKARRNIRILLEELNKSPNDPYLLYQIGKSYYMLKDYGEALNYFEKATGYDVDARNEWVLDLVNTYGYTMLELEEYNNALLLQGVADEFSCSSDFHFMMGLVYMNNAMFNDAVNAFLEAVDVGNAKVIGTDSYRAYYNIGVIYECLGRNEEALKYYNLAEDYDVAKQRISLLIDNK